MTTLTQNEAKSVSTLADTSVLWSSIIGITDDPITGQWIDPLTLTVSQLLNLKKTTQPHVYSSGNKITTISYQYYGTTSMWAILLYLNGFQHPDEIPTGAILNIPERSDLTDIIIKSAIVESSSYGKVFTI